MEINGGEVRRRERERVQMGYIGNVYLKSDILGEILRIRKSCLSEDVEGKVFVQKE